MKRNKVVIMVMVVAALATALISYALVSDGSGERPQSPSAVSADKSSVDLGITYLTITPAMAAQYDLGVDSGVLVTKVTRGSLADRAGIRSGDVILSFNGTPLGQKSPLLGMMRGCRTGNTIVVQVWRDHQSTGIEFVHAEK